MLWIVVSWAGLLLLRSCNRSAPAATLLVWLSISRYSRTALSSRAQTHGDARAGAALAGVVEGAQEAGVLPKASGAGVVVRAAVEGVTVKVPGAGVPATATQTLEAVLGGVVVGVSTSPPAPPPQLTCTSNNTQGVEQGRGEERREEDHKKSQVEWFDGKTRGPPRWSAPYPTWQLPDPSPPPPPLPLLVPTCASFRSWQGSHRRPSETYSRSSRGIPAGWMRPCFFTSKAFLFSHTCAHFLGLDKGSLQTPQQ